MKLVTELPSHKMLPALYNSAEIIAECLDVTHLMEIRKRKPTGLEYVPEMADDASAEETANVAQIKARNEIRWSKQIKENIMEMAKSLMKDHPEYAEKLFTSLIVLEEGESMPEGMKLFAVAIKALANEDVISFLRSVTVLADVM